MRRSVLHLIPISSTIPPLQFLIIVKSWRSGKNISEKTELYAPTHRAVKEISNDSHGTKYNSTIFPSRTEFTSVTFSRPHSGPSPRTQDSGPSSRALHFRVRTPDRVHERYNFASVLRTEHRERSSERGNVARLTNYRAFTCSNCSPKIVRLELTVSGVIFALLLTRIVEDRSDDKNSRADSDCLRGGNFRFGVPSTPLNSNCPPKMVVVRTTVFWEKISTYF
jgi:hypothetical protein